MGFSFSPQRRGGAKKAQRKFGKTASTCLEGQGKFCASLAPPRLCGENSEGSSPSLSLNFHTLGTHFPPVLTSQKEEYHFNSPDTAMLSWLEIWS